MVGNSYRLPVTDKVTPWSPEIARRKYINKYIHGNLVRTGINRSKWVIGGPPTLSHYPICSITHQQMYLSRGRGVEGEDSFLNWFTGKGFVCPLPPLRATIFISLQKFLIITISINSWHFKLEYCSFIVMYRAWNILRRWANKLINHSLSNLHLPNFTMETTFASWFIY